MTLYTKNQYNRYELNAELFIELVNSIAKFLGWQVDNEQSIGVISITNGTHGLMLRADTSPSNSAVANPKIDISCMLYTDTGQSLWRFISDAELKQCTTSISCSIKRGAESIAKDVQKRLLPDYLKLWERGLDLKQKSEERENRLRSMTQHLADIFGVYPHSNYRDGNKICTYPVLKDDIGIDVSIKKTITLDAEVRQAYNRETDIDDVKINMTLPYDLAEEFMQWIASKTINCFESWHTEMINTFVRWLDRDADKAGLPEVTELPPNNFDWKEAYRQYKTGDKDGITGSEKRVFAWFKESIIKIEVAPIEETIEAKCDRLSRPYDKDVLIRAYKGIGYDTNRSQLKEDLKDLTKQLHDLSDWTKQVVEKGLCNEFPDFYEDVERRNFIAELINKLESETTQPQPQIEAEPVAEPATTTREDDIKALFKDSPNEVEILCRLSEHTPQQYREVLKDELLRIRDRRVLRTKLELVRKVIKNNSRLLDEPRPKQILEILEQLDQLHSVNEITLLTKTLKKQFKTFKEAKLATNTKAVSWEKLAEKLAA